MSANSHSSSIWSYRFAANTTPQSLNVEEVIQKVSNFPTTLKDDKRSLVKTGELFGKTVVAKQPRDKNRRTWMRFLSLFRHSEARSSQETLTRFIQQGIPSVHPICVLEKRRFGCLVDSWLIYEFRDGSVSTLEQLPEVIRLLQKLHTNGYRHDDPNFGNFLVDEQGELFLIDCKGKQRLGLFSDYYDFMLLSQRNQGITLESLIETANINTDHWGYALAERYSNYKRKRTEFKAKRRAKKKPHA